MYKFAFYQERAPACIPVLYAAVVMALVVSIIQTPRTDSLLSNLHLQTVRIRCSPVTNLYAGLEDVVRAAIFLGNNQVDLAVEPNGIDRVNQRFANLSGLRLLSSGPLFTPQGNQSYAQGAFVALNEMRRLYYDEMNNTLLS